MTTPERHTEHGAPARAHHPAQLLMISIPLVLALLVLGASCGGTTGSGDDPGAGISASAPAATGGTGADTGEQTAKLEQAAVKATRVDPRKGGFEITMGEWAVTPEAKVIRPGLVTLVIANKGTVVHGFELKSESDDGTDLEWGTLQPGQTMRVNVRLGEGLYELECWVGEHDDKGMRAMLEVRRGAPLVKSRAASSGNGNTVDIAGFEYLPAVMTVESGETISWVNDDAAPHTVTENNGDFASKTLDSSSRFTMTFRRPGTYHYFCAVHPGMKGTVIVKP